MIAVTFALPEESQDLRALLQDSQQITTRLAGPVIFGLARGVPITIWHTGMGAEAAATEARALLGQCQPRLVISSGFAGGLKPELRVGDVVFDARDSTFSQWRARSCPCLPGAIRTHSTALETPSDKASLFNTSGAIAVDMETAAIASVCAEVKIPLFSLRGISDAAGDSLPVPMEHWFDLRRQRPRPLALVSYLARNPRRIVPFVRFVRGLSAPRRAMTLAILDFIADYAQSVAFLASHST